MWDLTHQEIGFLAVTGAVLFFGSFAVPLKTKRVQDANVDPMVFQLYYSISIFASGWLVLTYNKFYFTYFGIAGAALWVPASILSIFAINNMGMSISTGIWCGVTVVVSFLWGAVAFPKDHPVKNLPLSIVALVLLLLGIAGLSLSSTDLIKNLGKKKEDPNESINQESPLLPNRAQSPKRRPLVGFICAVALGILNGSMMVPLRYAPKESGGINYVISFSIGVMVVTPVCAFFYFLVQCKKPVFHFKIAVIPGLITGLLWSIGNFFTTYATLYLGLTIGFPLTQLALVVAGLWGLIVFRELSGVAPILLWIVSVLVLLGGAALLALFG